MNDLERLQRFASGDQDAFTEIVKQHVNAVYSTAWRILQNSHLAEEVTQDTFSLLARKAPTLRRDVIIIAWLHRTSWNLAMQTLRNELRRIDREQQITSADMTTPSPDPAWKQISPILDEGIESLGEPDRSAILLRFFEEKPSREISIALGISEDAARARISRAVEKLRLFFKRRGITLTSTALLTLLTTYTLQAAPATLALASNSAAQLASNSSAPASIGTKLLILLTQMKLKTAIICGIALLFALLVANQIRNNPRGRTESKNGQFSSHPATSNAPSLSFIADLKSRFNKETRHQKAEELALEKIKEILYAPDPESIFPPFGMEAAIVSSGSRKREALDMLRESIHSRNRQAAFRAATSLQFFREFADELIPEFLALTTEQIG
jgi:RNA polymerase sigma factor (sigma-70 family)